MIRRDWFFLLLVVMLGAIVRLDLLIANHFTIDADEAIVGLMADHIIAGQDFPTFYYGQHYMGSLEAICVAAVFSFLGSSAVALKIVPLFFSLILILLVYELALNAAGKNAARIAALLCAVPPSALVIWSAMARGGFIEIVVLGAIALLLLQRFLQSTEISQGTVALLGLVLGIGWWVNNQILYFMFPVAIFMLGKIIWWEQGGFFVRALNLIKVAFVGLFFWLLGGAPYWIYNIRHDWASLGMFEPAKSSDVAKYFSGLYETALPILLGGSRFWQGEDVFPGSKQIASSLYLGFFLAFLILRWRQIASLLILKVEQKGNLEIFLILLLACAIIFVSSSFGWLAQAPRYLLPMYVGIFVLCGYVLAFFIERSRIIGLTLLSIVLFCNLSSCYWGGRSVPGEPIVFRGDRVSKDHTEIIKWLESRNVHWIRTNYWIGYRLAFETNETVKFVVNQEPNQTRIADWAKLAKSHTVEEMPLVMVPSQARIIRKALALLNYSYTEQVVSGYHVFYDIKIPYKELSPIDHAQISVSSDLNSDMAKQALDGSIETRWGSGKHQVPGMQFTISLQNPTEVKAIRYNLGTWPQDFPRGLQMEFEKADGERVLYFDNQGWEAIRYLLEMQSELLIYIKPQTISKIILTQTGKHPIFDWSIAEIDLLQ